MFGSFGTGFGSFGAGVGGLLPSFTNITSWLKAPTTDGKTLANSKGADANLTGVNCIAVTSGDTITISGLSGSASVSSVASGSVTPTVSANTLTFGSSGFCSNIVLSDGTHLPLAEGSGTKAYDISGNGNNGVLTGTTWTTQNSIESWNHEYGFDTDIFKGYAGYWDISASAGGTWVANESNLTLTGNTATSGKFRQTVEGMDSGDTLVVSGTIVQTGGSGSNADVAISSLSAGFGGSTIFIGGAVGTYNFSTTLTANSTTCNIQFITVNGANVVMSNLKFTVVKKIPALNTKTKQVVTFDGSDDYVDTGVSDQLVKKYSVTFTPTVISDAVILGLRISRPACFELMSDGSIRTGLFEGEARANNTGANRTTTTTLVAGTKYTVEVDYDNNEIKINDVVQSTSITAGRNHTNDNVWIGGRQDSGALQEPFNGIIHQVKLESATAVLAEYDFQSDIGTNTVQDLSTNNNDGTVTVGSGGLDSFWGQRVADALGSLVSADYATGNTTISNPGGFVHNGSECGVAMVTNSLTSAQLFAIVNSSATETFVRKDNGNIIQILDYSSALTGDNLTRTRTYVG